MKILTFISVVIFAFAGLNDNGFYSEKQAAKMVQIALKEKGVEFVGEVHVSEKLDKYEPLKIYSFRKSNGENFYAVFTQAKGRYDYFDYLLAVNMNFEVAKIRILKYRSEHGGEIKSKKWLEQFVNYSSGELRYKKEISALSGATMSAKSLTADVPRVLKILKKSCE